MSKLKILACQIGIPAVATAAQRNQHLEDVAAKIRGKLEQEQHDLVVLPELSSVDYSRESFGNLEEVAETLDGPSFQVFSALAKEFNVIIVYGMPRKNERQYHISHAAVDANGQLLGYFDKLHIAQYGASMEKEYFERGDHLFVFEVNGIKVAPIICYDIRIPELTRTLVVEHGVQLILHCGAYARDETFYSWHHFSITRAVENQVFFLSLNRAGENYGDSVFCTPWIDENESEQYFDPHAEILKSLEMDTNKINNVREKYTFLADRFNDYKGLKLSS